MQGGADLIDMI